MASSAQSCIPVLAGLTELREAAGLTKSDLARHLHVNFSAVFRWESGEAAPTADKLPPMADLLDCSIDALFGRDVRPAG